MASEQQVEVESKFDVAPDFQLGDLTPLLPRGGHLNFSTVDLTSTYFDTPSLDLLRHHLTLRRRTGEADTGWHLKVPGEGFRTELRWPLGDGESDTIPALLANLVAPFTAGRPIGPVVRLRVLRTRHQVIDGDGNMVLEIADDEVRAEGLGGQEPAMPRWREVEAEVGPSGGEKDLAHASDLLVEHGAFPSRSRSKLARALRGNPAEAPDHTSTAGDALMTYFDTQRIAIVGGYFAIQLKPFEPDSTQPPHEAVHQTRVATRRLRALLRTFGPLFEAEPTARLEDELRWYATELGEVRDREVLRARLAKAVDDLPAYLVVGPVAKRIDDLLLGELEQHAAALLSTMSDERYAALLTDLANWSDNPPFTPEADKPARILSDYVVRAEKKLERRMRKASEPETDVDPALHSARKQGKRVRYAAEAAGPSVGRHARHLIDSAAKLQKLLGEHQDAVVATELLRRVAEQAADEGENAFTYGILVGEQRRAALESASAARRAAKHKRA